MTLVTAILIGGQIVHLAVEDPYPCLVAQAQTAAGVPVLVELADGTATLAVDVACSCVTPDSEELGL